MMNHTAEMAELSFEEAMQKLEGILEKMSAPEAKLEDMLVLYEEGVAFLKICKSKLGEAEAKISILNERLAKEAENQEH